MKIVPIVGLGAGTVRSRRNRRSAGSMLISMRSRPRLEQFESRVLLSAPPVVLNVDSMGFGEQSGASIPARMGNLRMWKASSMSLP